MANLFHTILICATVATTIPNSGIAARRCLTTCKLGAPVKISSAIRLEVERGFPTDLLHEAIALWETCPTYGSGFPRFITEGEGDFIYTLRFESKRPCGACCAYIRGDEITVFTSVRDAQGHIHSCGSLAENLAHELGHLLDLADAGGDSACQTSVMGSLSTWKLDSKKRRPRSLHESVCQIVDDRWLTWEELEEVQSLSAGFELVSQH